MSHETLADEATRFFGALKTKRTKTIQTKMADFVQKEDQLRTCIFFKICKEKGGEGVRRRASPLSFKLKDVTLKGMISEKDSRCDICGTILLGRDESERHLRSEHFKEYKSLCAKECLVQTRDHAKYKEWEGQETFIEGLTFYNLEEIEAHAGNLKKKHDAVQDKRANEEKDSDQTFKTM